MKTRCLLALAATAIVVHAGSPEPAITPPSAPAASNGDFWLIPMLNIRARFEYGDVDGLQDSNAFTVRERVGLKTREWNGLSAVVQGEFTQALVTDYDAGGGAPPHNAGQTVISDPRNAELDEAYLQYSGFDSALKLGRQPITYDNGAFIGNVGWRQNQQTYDAAFLTNNSIEGLTLKYAYANQINRIFGNNATGTNKDVTGDINLFNASYTGIKNLTVGGYAYLMQFDAPAGWDNNTFGVSTKWTPNKDLTLYGELAWQDEAGPSNNKSAAYGHLFATQTLFGDQTLTVGIEQLDSGFQTPLATLHAFNGWADVFVAARITGAHGGITNPYISHMVPIFFGIKWTNTLMAFGDNSLSPDRGWEYDSMLVKKFNDHFTAIAQFAYFDSDGVNLQNPYPTTTRFSLELNYTF